MDESQNVQNRRQHRSQVVIAAALEMSGGSHEVKVCNLSVDGALVEGNHLPVEGSQVRLRRDELNASAKVVWVRGQRAGLAFNDKLPPEAVLRHVPTSRPRVVPEFRRSGSNEQLTEAERLAAADWVWRPTVDRPGK